MLCEIRVDSVLMKLGKVKEPEFHRFISSNVGVPVSLELYYVTYAKTNGCKILGGLI